MSKLITLDLETFYSSEFSLTKLTTEAYVRDPQFQTIGISIKINAASAVWYPRPEVKAALAAIDWSDAIVIAQNTAFDGAILKWHYDINPMLWADTLGMSRALFPHDKSHSLAAQAVRAGIGAKGDEVLRAIGKRYEDFTSAQLATYGEYCCNDTELTYTLFMGYMHRGFPKHELKLLDLTLRLFIDPVLQLDSQMLKTHLIEVRDRKESLLDTVRDLMLEGAEPDFVHAVFTEGTTGIKKLLMSNPKFAAVLFKLGVEPPIKLSPTTGKPTYAFAKSDPGMQALTEHPDELVQALVAARLGNKSTLEETRTERFIGMAARGTFPVPLRYYGAHSGRWSGQDRVNLQNLPARGPNAGKIKKAILPPEGYVFIDCDSAQIEARTLAWMAGQTDLVEAFRNKEDVYKLMASSIYRVPVAAVTTSQRQVGKVVILGCGYGVGPAKLRITVKAMAGVDISAGEAKRIIDAYRTTYAMIPKLWAKAQEALIALSQGTKHVIDVQGLCTTDAIGITLPSGLHIQYPELRKAFVEGKSEWNYKSKGLITRIYGGAIIENCCQAVARCIIGEQMTRVAKKYTVVMTVHDSIGIIAPVAEAKEAQQFLEECMRWVPKWAGDLPLNCESGMGTSYGDC